MHSNAKYILREEKKNVKKTQTNATASERNPRLFRLVVLANLRRAFDHIGTFTVGPDPDWIRLAHDRRRHGERGGGFRRRSRGPAQPERTDWSPPSSPPTRPPFPAYALPTPLGAPKSVGKSSSPLVPAPGNSRTCGVTPA